MNRNLKSLAVLLALLVTLTACQPTPESEPVANKGAGCWRRRSPL